MQLNIQGISLIIISDFGMRILDLPKIGKSEIYNGNNGVQALDEGRAQEVCNLGVKRCGPESTARRHNLLHRSLVWFLRALG
jgi:hypothetical protein